MVMAMQNLKDFISVSCTKKKEKNGAIVTMVNHGNEHPV